jgi:hypothetical protein
MDRFYLSFLLVASGFLVWAHTHTDELPMLLGLVLLTAAGLAAAYPRRFLTTSLVLGAMLFVAETLVHFGLLRAPYPASAGLPWVALVAYVPAVFGVGLGAAGRRLLV